MLFVGDAFPAGHWRDANDVGADMTVGSYFRGSLEHGAGCEGICPLHDTETTPVGGGVKRISQVLRVYRTHVRESWTPCRIVRTYQRVYTYGVDVIPDDDEVSRTQSGIDAA